MIKTILKSDEKKKGTKERKQAVLRYISETELTVGVLKNKPKTHKRLKTLFNWTKQDITCNFQGSNLFQAMYILIHTYPTDNQITNLQWRGQTKRYLQGKNGCLRNGCKSVND